MAGTGNLEVVAFSENPGFTLHMATQPSVNLVHYFMVSPDETLSRQKIGFKQGPWA